MGCQSINMLVVLSMQLCTCYTPDFFTKALYDFGLIDFDEPFKRLVHQGIITSNGAKMSKSKGNVVNPDQFVEKYGSDTFRM